MFHPHPAAILASLGAINLFLSLPSAPGSLTPPCILLNSTQL